MKKPESIFSTAQYSNIFLEIKHAAFRIRMWNGYDEDKETGFGITVFNSRVSPRVLFLSENDN